MTRKHTLNYGWVNKKKYEIIFISELKLSNLGTHSNGPSKLENLNTSLSDYLKQNKNVSIGEKISEHFYTNVSGMNYGDLPFLFKVLSINQALSIQAHPNKQLAKELHSKDAKNYPDSNHKPEMLIAISETFEAMCGFSLASKLKENFQNYPELVELCNKDNVNDFLNNTNNDLEEVLKKCFTSMMNRSDQFVTSQFEQLKTRLETKQDLTYLDDLFMRLAKQYPNDVGCFSVYLLNCIKLKKGEAIYLSANVPHAYLFGDGVECMACSDNVVRAGLTPKFKDVNILCEMLDYSMRSIDENILQSTKIESSIDKDYLIEYRPSVDEFSVQQIKITNQTDNGDNVARFLIPKNESGSILIIVELDSNTDSYFELDNGTQINGLKSGCVYFIDSLVDITYVAKSRTENKTTLLLAYRAFCDIKSN